MIRISKGKHAELVNRQSSVVSSSKPESIHEVFAKAFAINPAAIAVVCFDNGLIVDVNESWQAMFGYSREEAIGHSALELNLWLTMVDRDSWIKQMQKAASIRNLELTVLRRSGEKFVALCSAELMKVADKKFILSTWLDISDRKRIEEELRDSKEYLNQIINNIGDPLFVKDSQHRMVLVNAAMCAFAGVSAADFLGKAAHDYLSEETATSFWHQEEQVLTTGGSGYSRKIFTTGRAKYIRLWQKKSAHRQARQEAGYWCASRYNGPKTSAGSVSTVTENGGYRNVGRRGGSRLQQSAQCD